MNRDLYVCVRCRTNDCILSNRSPIQEKNVRLTCEYGIYIFLIFGQIVTNRSFFLCTVLFWYDSLSFGVMYIVTSTITFPAKVNIYIQSITLSLHRFCHCCCRSISPNALTAHSCSPFYFGVVLFFPERRFFKNGLFRNAFDSILIGAGGLSRNDISDPPIKSVGRARFKLAYLARWSCTAAESIFRVKSSLSPCSTMVVLNKCNCVVYDWFVYSNVDGRMVQ